MMTRLALPILALAALAAPRPTVAQMDVPFGVGERMDYDVRFSAIKVGNGSMEVMRVEDIRGRDAWVAEFRVKGGTFFYRVNDVMRTWIDRDNFNSLRFQQDLDQGGRDRERTFEIYPDREVFVQTAPSTANGDPEEQPSVDQPLDDASFLYFVRTVPLEVGQTYQFHRYFRPDRNPVTIRVLRKEKVKVPAGEFDAIVIQPIIKSRGIFSEGGEAQIWLSDDDRRIMLQMKSKLSFGSLNLYLRSYRPGTAPADATP